MFITHSAAFRFGHVYWVELLISINLLAVGSSQLEKNYVVFKIIHMSISDLWCLVNDRKLSKIKQNLLIIWVSLMRVHQIFNLFANHASFKWTTFRWSCLISKTIRTLNLYETTSSLACPMSGNVEINILGPFCDSSHMRERYIR